MVIIEPGLHCIFNVQPGLVQSAIIRLCESGAFIWREAQKYIQRQPIAYDTVKCWKVQVLVPSYVFCPTP